MSNFIKVTDKLAIASDANQWKIKELQGQVKKDDVMVDNWVSISYFRELEQAVKYLGRHMLRISNCTSYKELVEAANDISLLLGQKFTASADVSIKQEGE